MSKANRTMLWLILIAEFFWYMADNGISTFLVNYTRYYLQASTGSVSLTTIFSGVASVIGFALAGFIVTKIGRKWTLSMGLLITLGAYAAWMIFGYAFPPAAVSGTELNPFPIFLYVIFVLKGFGMGLVHVNSFPMVVELCSGKRVGRFTGYYYASSMASQTVTPILLGSLMLMPQFSFRELPVYAVGCVLVSVVCFLFVKNIRSKKENIKTGLEAIGADD
ncbi:MAG: MFS transporter [Bacilli bacterium]|nr:MFS transporter [Bacilli bacterium]